MDENAHGDLKIPPPESVGARWLGCGTSVRPRHMKDFSEAPSLEEAWERPRAKRGRNDHIKPCSAMDTAPEADTTI